MCSKLVFAEFEEKSKPHQQHKKAHHKATVRREEKVQRHEIGSAGAVHTHHKSKSQSKEAATVASTEGGLIITEHITSGSPVKIRNRHDNSQFLAVCHTCSGVVANATAHQLDNSCPGTTANQGCGFTVQSTRGGEFDIVKVGAANGVVIHNNDLVVLKSKPNGNTDASNYGYLGVCGLTSKHECAGGAASFVRTFTADPSGATDDVLKHATMWIIAREGGAEGALDIGDYISFHKAFSESKTTGLIEEGSGAALSSCGAAATENACGATNNLYTVELGTLSTQEEVFKGQWQIEPSGTQHAAIHQQSQNAA
jgi:hypothetical protein